MSGRASSGRKRNEPETEPEVVIVPEGPEVAVQMWPDSTGNLKTVQWPDRVAIVGYGIKGGPHGKTYKENVGEKLASQCVKEQVWEHRLHHVLYNKWDHNAEGGFKKGGIRTGFHPEIMESVFSHVNAVDALFQILRRPSRLVRICCTKGKHRTVSMYLLLYLVLFASGVTAVLYLDTLSNDPEADQKKLVEFMEGQPRSQDDFLPGLSKTSHAFSNALQVVGVTWKDLHPLASPRSLHTAICNPVKTGLPPAKKARLPQPVRGPPPALAHGNSTSSGSRDNGRERKPALDVLNCDDKLLQLLSYCKNPQFGEEALNRALKAAKSAMEGGVESTDDDEEVRKAKRLSIDAAEAENKRLQVLEEARLAQLEIDKKLAAVKEAEQQREKTTKALETTKIYAAGGPPLDDVMCEILEDYNISKAVTQKFATLAAYSTGLERQVRLMNNLLYRHGARQESNAWFMSSVCNDLKQLNKDGSDGSRAQFHHR